MVPDYTSSAAENFTNFSKKAVRKMGFELLMAVQTPVKVTSLPSRAVDLSISVICRSENESDENINLSWHSMVHNLCESRADKTILLPHGNILFEDAYGEPYTLANTAVKNALAFSHRRRCFTTDTSQTGLDPAELQLGDRTYRCVGVEVPFSFREDGTPSQECEYKSVRLVGECMMDSAPYWDEMSREDLDCLHFL